MEEAKRLLCVASVETIVVAGARIRDDREVKLLRDGDELVVTPAGPEEDGEDTPVTEHSSTRAPAERRSPSSRCSA